MPRLFLETKVHAALETAWQVLLDRAENPGNYGAELTKVTVTERFADGFLQEVQAQGMTVKQRVFVDKERGELRYQILEHPLLKGILNTRIQPTSVQSPVAPVALTILFDWTTTEAGEHKVADTALRSQVERELLAIKGKAEELEQAA